MLKKTFAMLFLLALLSSAGLGQSSFQGLTPGQSTRADVERVLGQPVRVVSETLSEYKSDKETEKIFVQYRRDSSIVRRIEAIYAGTIDRSTVIRSLNLPARPTASQTNTQGRLEEYFAEANIVLTYASGDAASGVSRAGYYSRELFESAVANVPRASQDNRATADSSGPERSKPETTPRAGRSSTSATRLSPESEKATTETLPAPSTDSSSGVTVMRIPPELKDGSGALSLPDVGSSVKEFSLSRERLESLVGKYQFDSPDALPLQEVTVDEVDGKLRWNVGAAKYMLIHTGVGQETDAAGRVVKDILQFKLDGKPGAKVQFMLIHGEVMMLLYLDEKAGEMITVVGTPKR